MGDALHSQVAFSATGAYVSDLTMRPSTRNMVGSLTSLFWIGTGTYMIFNGVDEMWRMVGYAVVAVGIGRAALLARDWKKHNQQDR